MRISNTRRKIYIKMQRIIGGRENPCRRFRFDGFLKQIDDTFVCSFQFKREETEGDVTSAAERFVMIMPF